MTFPRSKVVLFLEFNAWAFLFIIGGPIVGASIAFSILKINETAVDIAILDVVSCTAYAWWFAIESFRSFPERLWSYYRLRDLYLTHSEVKKSILWELKKRPCGDLVVGELEREFGKLV